MKILYLIGGYGESHIGGLVHREMALRIRALGHDYRIFAPAATGDAARQADPFDEGVLVHRVARGGGLLGGVNRLAAALLRHPWVPALAGRLARLLRTAGPFDVLIAEGVYPMGVVSWMATRRTRVPYVVSVIGGDFLANEAANYGYARYAVPRRLMGAALSGASVVRAISPYAGARAVALGCSPDKLALVQRNIAATAFLPDAAEREAFRRGARRQVAGRFGLGEAPLLVSVGRLMPIKGFDVLVRALPSLTAAGARSRLLLVGPDRHDTQLGGYRDHLESLARGLGIAERLVFAGSVPLPEVREYLAAADVVAVPSLEEGGNKVLVEAAAVGTPFVATRTSGNAEWARPWHCGLIVEPQSPEALAAGLQSLLADPALAVSMGKRGLPFAEQFRTPVVADRMLALCEHALRGGPLASELREPEGLRHPAADVEVPA